MAALATRMGNSSGIDYAIFPNDITPITDTPVWKLVDVERLRKSDNTLSPMLSSVVCIDYYDTANKRHRTAYQFWILSKNGPLPDFSKTPTVGPDTLKLEPIGSFAN